jgi:hypothetical protein
MPFGLSNAPATFQRIMNIVLSGLTWQYCMVYLDDIVIYSADLDEHLLRLTTVLQRLSNVGMKLNPQKCVLLMKQLHYLGHVVSADGVSVSEDKVTAMLAFPRPGGKNPKKQLYSFIQLCAYYRHFIKDFAKIAAPLRALLPTTVPFIWTAKCENAFVHLKHTLTQTPVLMYPDFDKDFSISVDASGRGLGAVLSQLDKQNRECVIAYASRALSKEERKYGTTEREACGLVWSLEHFRPYIHGHHTDVYVDHQPLKWLMTARDPTGRLSRWALRIQPYLFTLHYKPGSKHSNADALSRCTDCTEEMDDDDNTADNTIGMINDTIGVIDTLTEDECLFVGMVEDVLDRLPQMQRTDPELRPYVQYLETGVLPTDPATARKVEAEARHMLLSDQSVLLYSWSPKTHRDGRIPFAVVVPAGLRDDVLRTIHDSPLSGGHLGFDKTYDRCRQRYWWPQMAKDIQLYCVACHQCQRANSSKHMKDGALHTIPVGEPWEKMSVDFMHLPMSDSGNRWLLVFVDHMTKFCEAVPLGTCDATTVATAFIHSIICRYGAPSVLLSDCCHF